MISRFELSDSNKKSIYLEYSQSQTFSQNLVILLHGFKGFYSWGFFEPMKKYLNDAGFHVLSFNFSHNGVVAHGQEITDFETFRQNDLLKEQDDIERVLNFFSSDPIFKDIIRIDAIAHSRGAASMLIHQKRQNRFRRMIALAPFLNFYHAYPDHIIEEGRKKGFFEVLNRRTGEMLKIDFSFYTTLLENKDQFNLYQDINLFGDELKVIHGTSDETVDILESITWLKSNKSVKFQTMKDTNHSFNYVQEHADNERTFEMFNHCLMHLSH